MNTPIPVTHCRYCSSTNLHLTWCECTLVKYCSARCKTLDRQRHSGECNLDNTLLIPKEYVLALSKFLDPQGPFAKTSYFFLLTRIARRDGGMFVVPLLDRGTNSIARRMGLGTLDAYVVTWAPSTTQRGITQAPYFMYVLDEKCWTNCITPTIGSTRPPQAEEVSVIETEMYAQGFLTGASSAILVSDGSIRVVNTKDVYPS